MAGLLLSLHVLASCAGTRRWGAKTTNRRHYIRIRIPRSENPPRNKSSVISPAVSQGIHILVNEQEEESMEEAEGPIDIK